jgi:stage II sporulation protein P
MKRAAAILLLMLLTLPAAISELDDGVYSLYSEDGELLTTLGGMMYVGDEYIAGDDRFYRVVSVDRAARTAEARCLGMAERDERALAAFAAQAAKEKDGGRLICMYSTHSDESYVPDDGAASRWEDAGIYDVGRALKDSLEKRGIRVIYSDETFLPHDAGAYSRSRATAEELLKKQPDALFDVHRDAVPAEQYETTVDGEKSSKIRLFVGRSNANAASNKAFAREIKAVADEKYPGLVKDIYIGRGEYNQDLYGQALLLEMGTHEIDKDRVLASTDYLAEVIDTVLYGESARASENAGQKSAAVTKGIAWAVGLAVLAAAVYALVSTGSLGGMWMKLRRGVSEISGGLLGRGPKDEKRR